MPASILETLESYADVYLVDPERAAREYYTDDVVMHTSGEHQFAGDHHGRDAIVAVLAAVRRWTEGTIRLSKIRFARPMVVHPASVSPEPWSR